MALTVAEGVAAPLVASGRMGEDRGDWREIGEPERRLAAAIIESSGVTGWENLVEDLQGALVRNEADWVLDLRPQCSNAGADVPDGPLSVAAYVPNLEAFEGEILIWIDAGHVSGIEYAWVTDEPPTLWPDSELIQIIPD
ncbi:hypothetical protein [Nocardia sp. NBC_00511]|uniref:hypothetical protein n=1 Tax=Nocardia sp. NBC_00511 TaxID=2903591 RepID=UPI0030E1AFD8